MIETNSSEIRIEALATRPDCIPALAELLHDEWGHLANWSDGDALIRELGKRAQTRTAPCALVALDGEGLAGSASIKIRELPHHDDKEFWVGDVIVTPDCRGKGLVTG